MLRPSVYPPTSVLTSRMCKLNPRYLRDSLRGGDSYIRAQNGGKTAYIREDASQAVWDKAERFLL